MIVYSTDGMLPQRFSFPEPIMHYILKNAQPQHLLKLYQSCKFFYDKIGINVIPNLEIVGNDEKESIASTTASVHISTLPKFEKFCVTESFVVRTQEPDTIIPYFQCTLKKLELNGFVSMNALQSFAEDGNIEELKIKGVFSDGNFLGIEDILAMVPNATSVEISECLITPATYASLIELNHKAKFTNFVLKNIIILHFTTTGFNLLKDFLLKNAEYDCNIHMDFKLLPELDAAGQAINEQLKELGINCSESLATSLIEKKNELENEKYRKPILIITYLNIFMFLVTAFIRFWYA